MSGFRLRITGRIYAAFGALIALTLGLAVFGGWQLSSVAGDFGNVAGFAESSARVLQIGQDLEVMRRSALAFRFDGNDGSLAAGNEAAPHAVTLLQESKRTLSEERRSLYQQVEADIGTFEQARADMIAVVRRLRTERATLFTVGDELSAATIKLVSAARAIDDIALASDAAAVESAILLVRVANWRFQATADPKGPATFQAASDKAAKALAALESRPLPAPVRAVMAPVNQGLERYSMTFQPFSENMIRSASIYDEELAPRIAKMQQSLATASASLRQSFETAQTSGNASLVRTSLLQKAVAGIVLLLGGAVAFLIGRSIANPIRAVTAAMRRLAEGDLSVEIPGRTRRDEIGEIGRAVDAFKVKAAEKALREADAQQAQAAAAAAERKAEMHRLAGAFEAAVGTIVRSIADSATDLEAAAGVLGRTADTTQQLSGMVAVASEEASGSVQSVASSAEEMASSVGEIGRQVQQSSHIAHSAVEQAQKTDSRMGELSQAAARIGDVVNLITAVAEQTNLLALNATIEAARAGDAGRGFAVVAQEVKALAGQTAKATDEISSQIAAMQTATQDSVVAIKEIGSTIHQVSEIAAAIAAAVEEQGAATGEITRNAQHAAQGTAQVATNIADVNRGASETGTASAKVLTSARSLATDGSRLHQAVDEFLATVRAA